MPGPVASGKEEEEAGAPALFSPTAAALLTARLPPAPPALYVFSPTAAALSARLPVNTDRPSLVHALVAALPSFLDGAHAVARVAPPASLADLAAFHTAPYLALLAGGWATADRDTLAAAGLEDDCPPFPGLWEFVRHTAGGTLAAAAALAGGLTRTAFALDGGRHHARPGAAAGFCYVNDAVLAINLLSAPPTAGCTPGRRRRVLYLDVDAHHGDGVEAAFAGEPAVLTISIHHSSPGFYPGTGGAPGAGGGGRGAGFALNLPLARGARDDTFLFACSSLVGPALALFQPAAVVLQLGADGLARDPVADAWSLSPAAFGRLTAAVWGWCAPASTPLLILGGGGYSSTETAKAWACGVCGAVGVDPPADVPDHEHVGRYGPHWRLRASAVPPTVRDENEVGAVTSGVQACLAGLRAGVAREFFSGGGV